MVINPVATGGGGGLKVVAEGVLFLDANEDKFIDFDTAAKFAIVSVENSGSKTGVALAGGPRESLAMGARIELSNNGKQLRIYGPTYGSEFRYIAIG